MINKFSIFDLMPNQEVLPLNPKFPCLVKWVWKKNIFHFYEYLKKLLKFHLISNSVVNFRLVHFSEICVAQGVDFYDHLFLVWINCVGLPKFYGIRGIESLKKYLRRFLSAQPREPYFQWFINLNKNPFPWDIKSPTFLSWICDMVFC